MIPIPEKCERGGIVDIDTGSFDIPCNKKATHYVIVEDNSKGGIKFYCEHHAKEVEEKR